MAVSTKNFNYLQASASPMAGTAGYLDSILYACLVTGYNSKTVSSISVSSNVATITTSTSHNLTVNDIIVISGANESVFNNEFRIKAITSSTTFTIDLTTADGSATGTITCKIAPLGWTRVYTGTNKSVYRAPAGTQFYLRIDDTQAQYATVSAYESMTTVDAGTNLIGTVYWKKSNASDTATREWYLIGNNKTFYLFAAWHSTYSTLHAGYAFGDINSVKANDIYACMLIGHSANNPYGPSYLTSFSYITFSTSSTYYTGQYLARSASGIIGGINCFKFSAPNGQMGYASGMLYPNPADNGLHLYPVDVGEVTGPVYRGRMPGLYTPLEITNGAIASNDRSVVINGKTYMAIKVNCVNNLAGNCFFDLGDW